MPYLSSCNICCGFHSSNSLLIEQTIEEAIRNELKLGAHPSYNDRKNFGRISIDQDISITLADIKYQIAAIKGMIESRGKRLHHVKAHGALYHDLSKHPELGIRFIELIKSFGADIQILGMANSEFADLCSKYGVGFINEAFADRRYESRSTLLSRKYANAVIHDEQDIENQVRDLLSGTITDHKGCKHVINVDSICLHSDTKGSVQLAKKINTLLKSLDFEIA